MNPRHHPCRGYLLPVRLSIYALAATGLLALAACSSASAAVPTSPAAAKAELKACQALSNYVEYGAGMLDAAPIERAAAGTPLAAPLKAWVKDTGINDTTGLPGQAASDDADKISAVCQAVGVEVWP